MTYVQSLRAISAAEANYNRVCDEAATEAELATALDILHRAKADHRARFGSLRRVAGEWV